jgi:hypothetical protein
MEFGDNLLKGDHNLIYLRPGINIITMIPNLVFKSGYNPPASCLLPPASCLLPPASCPLPSPHDYLVTQADLV